MNRTKHFVLLLLLMFGTLGLMSQSAVRGVMVDNSTNETLVGASLVLEDDPSVGVTTDLDGSFILNLEQGEHSIVVSYVGYLSDTIHVILENGKTMELGKYYMDPSDIGLKQVEVFASYAIDRKTPVAVSTISGKQIEKRLGSLEVPQLLNFTPSVYTTRSGGGFGDARINIRGFDQRNVAVLINGIPVNDMENGWVYWSNWAGLGDATRAIQVQRGLGASKLAINSVGGTMNIITKTTDVNRSGSFSFSMSDWGRMKSMLHLSSGQMKKGWAISFTGSRTTGPGYIDKAYVDAWSYFFSVSKQFNKDHMLVLTAIGAPQKHGQRRDFLSQEQVDKYGTRYNPNWGYYNGRVIHQRENYYHKPQIALNWYYTISEKTNLSTSAYVSFGRGGGSGPLGSYYGQKTEDGQIDYDDIFFNNANHTDTLFQAVRNDPVINRGDIVYDDQGNPIVGGYSQSILRNSVNHHNWYGILSTLNHRFNDHFNLKVGIDGRMYKGMHYREVRDLLGGEFYFEEYKYAKDGIGFRDQYRSVNTNYWEVLDESKRIAYDNDGLVSYAGMFAQLEYTVGNLSIFGAGTFNNNWYKRVDRYNYLGDETKTDGTPGTIQTSQQVTKVAYNAKLGANYNINEHNNIFVNAGYYERAPFFSNVFVNYANDVATDMENEKVAAVELGWAANYRVFQIHVDAYWTRWSDKSLLSRSFKDPVTGDDTRAFINGLNALHQGLEVEGSLLLSKNFKLGVVAGIGDWKWTNNVEAVIVNDATQDTLADITVYADGLRVANQPQTQLGGRISWLTKTGWNASIEYIWYDRLYAEFDPADRDDPDEIGMQPYRLPSYGIANLYMGYDFPLVKSTKSPINAYVGLNVNNLLNTTYIAEGIDGSSHDLDTFNGWWGYGRNLTVTAKIYF